MTEGLSPEVDRCLRQLPAHGGGVMTDADENEERPPIVLAFWRQMPGASAAVDLVVKVRLWPGGSFAALGPGIVWDFLTVDLDPMLGLPPEGTCSRCGLPWDSHTEQENARRQCAQDEPE